MLNASSGGGAAEKAAEQLKEIFGAAGQEARITLATGGEEINTAMRRAVEGGCETLVAGGGDGTINTGASAVLPGAFPWESCRSARSTISPRISEFLSIWRKPLRVVLAGIVCTVDVGEVNGRLFLNNSSLGVYPAIVRLRERYQAGGRSKWIAALWASLAVLRRNPFLAVRISTEDETTVRRTPFVFVGNNEYRMVGLNPGTRESIAGRHLAVYVLNAERRRGLIQLAWQIVIKGVNQVKELDLLTVDAITIETRRRNLKVALDGEVVTLESPLELSDQARSLASPRAGGGFGLLSSSARAIFHSLIVPALVSRSIRQAFHQWPGRYRLDNAFSVLTLVRRPCHWLPTGIGPSPASEDCSCVDFASPFSIS